MKIVFILWENDCEGDTFQGVFSTREAAQAAIPEYDRYYAAWRVDEVTLDQIPE
jgi:hypothetical protein